MPPLIVRRFVMKIKENSDPEPVPFEELSEAEQQEIRRKNAERISSYFNRTLQNDLPRAYELYRKGIILKADKKSE